LLIALASRRPGYTKRVPGEGMPCPADPKQRGDLILSFNIEFPVYMPICNKGYVKRGFRESRTCQEDARLISRFILADKVRRRADEGISIRRRANDEADQLRALCET